MRAALRVSVWILVLVACAGAGALVAAHSNPFQPEVQGASPSPSANTVVESWTMRIKSNSWHQLFVGGRCRSRWRGTVSVTVSPAGQVNGGGRVRLGGSLACAFPNAQIQEKVVRLSIVGAREAGSLALMIREVGGVPAGAHDYGGFTNTVLKVKLVLPARDGERTVRLSRSDATGRGRFESITVFTLACIQGCTAG